MTNSSGVPLDANGIPVSAGNRKTRRALAKDPKAKEDAVLMAEYEHEPFWQKMEELRDMLQAVYMTNPWIQEDEQVLAVIQQERDDFQKNEQKIRDMIADEKDKAHEEIERKFNHVEDKKILQLQLHAMRREYKVVSKAVRLNEKVNGKNQKHITLD